MIYIGENRFYTDPVTKLTTKLINGERCYQTAIIRDSKTESVSIGEKGEIYITYPLGELEKEWKMKT